MKKNIFILSFILILLSGLAQLDVFGLTSILLVTLIIFFFAKRWPEAETILYTALIIRVLVIFLSNYYIVLPDSQGDARIFELQAYEWSKNGFLNILKINPGDTQSFLISYIIAVFYSLLDRSMIMAQSISLLFGTLSVLMSWIITQKIWGNRVAMSAGWFTALFPSLILYSCLVMREVYVCFFILLAINNIISWMRTGSIKSFCFVILSFLLGTLFHGGVFIGLIVFTTIVILLSIKKIFFKFFNGVINFKSTILFLILITIGFFTLNNYYIPKIGKITEIKLLKKSILKKNIVTHRGDAKYPDWIIARSEIELIYKAPMRMIYFAFGPFPWNIKKNSHLIGMLDGFLYIFLFYLILLNRKAIFEDPNLRIILLLLLVYLFVYGIGVANFGTAFRHRVKFSIMFILLAAPLLPKFTFSKKDK